MLRQFLSEAAAPQPLSQLPATIVDQPLTDPTRGQLLADMELLAGTTALPAALPAAIPCLIVEAGAYRIVLPEAQGRLEVRHKAAGPAMLVPVSLVLLSSLGPAFCQSRSDRLPPGPARGA